MAGGRVLVLDDIVDAIRRNLPGLLERASMTPIWMFLCGVVFGVVLGWGVATLRYGTPRTPDGATLAAVLDRIKRESRNDKQSWGT